MEYSNLFVCLMGICTVFVGLICIIILVTIMSAIVKKADKPGKEAAVTPTPAVQGATASAGAVTPQMAAAVSAVLAEEMGTDVSGIRIVSFKKVNS